MREEIIAGLTFSVTSVSYGSDEGESLEFVIADGPAVAVTQRDDNSPAALYVSVDGEIEATVLEELIAYSRRHFGLR